MILQINGEVGTKIRYILGCLESYFPWNVERRSKSEAAIFAFFSMAESKSVFFIGLEERI